MNVTVPVDVKNPTLSNSENENDIDPNNPFKGDCLGREAFANTLMEKFKTLQHGKVIAIDAKWGEGKTWFGKNFQTLLEEKCFRTCWIDTFENDHFDDPFLLISAEIYKLMHNNEATLGDAFLEKASKVAGLVGKIIVNTAGKHLAGTTNLDECFAESVNTSSSELLKSVSNSSAKFIEEQIKNYTKKDESIQAFRDALTNYCESSVVKPVIIFVDELDRCKPTFALAFLERLKHYFNIPNLVFVLLLNQESLCATVKKTYGQEIDPDEYLQKFIGIQLALFTPENKAVILEPLAEPYLSEENKEAGILLKDILNSLMEESFPISLRQLHKIFSHFWLLPHSNTPIQLDKKIWMFLLVIKYIRPVEYKKITISPREFKESEFIKTLKDVFDRQLGGNDSKHRIEAVMLIYEIYGRLAEKEQEKEIFEMVSKGIEVLNTFIN